MFRHEIKSGKKGSAEENANYVLRLGKYENRAHELIYSEHGNLPSCATDPIELSKAADKYERKNGSVYREHVITLPIGLTDQQYIETARELIASLAGKKPYILAVHKGKSSLEGTDNPHVHGMLSDREPDGHDRTAAQHFSRAHPTNPELGGCRKQSGGMTRIELAEQAKQQRKVTAEILNRRLSEYGRPERVDHRSLADRGIDRLPERPLGVARIAKMGDEEKKAYVDARRRSRAD